MIGEVCDKMLRHGQGEAVLDAVQDGGVDAQLLQEVYIDVIPSPVLGGGLDEGPEVIHALIVRQAACDFMIENWG